MARVKVVRKITIEGEEKWVAGVISRSLPIGTSILSEKNEGRITVEELESNLPSVYDNRGLFKEVDGR